MHIYLELIPLFSPKKLCTGLEPPCYALYTILVTPTAASSVIALHTHFRIVRHFCLSDHLLILFTLDNRDSTVFDSGTEKLV